MDDVRVLVVEDNTVLADRIADGLRDAGMAVDVAYDGAAGLEKAGSPTTTWWCWTATCPGCTATGCARSWWPGRPSRASSC